MEVDEGHATRAACSEIMSFDRPFGLFGDDFANRRRRLGWDRFIHWAAKRFSYHRPSGPQDVESNKHSQNGIENRETRDGGNGHPTQNPYRGDDIR